jgi:hypothetical protein
MSNQLREPTIVDARRAPPQKPAGLSAIGLGTVLIGAFLPMADFFIVNVALPTIQTTLHASAAMLELVVAGYGLAYAMLLVLGGRLGDAIGRRPLFLAGMAAFTVTSLACGLAPTAGLLVAARVAQGASAALMVPQVLPRSRPGPSEPSGPARWACTRPPAESPAPWGSWLAACWSRLTPPAPAGD